MAWKDAIDHWIRLKRLLFFGFSTHANGHGSTENSSNKLICFEKLLLMFSFKIYLEKLTITQTFTLAKWEWIGLIYLWLGFEAEVWWSECIMSIWISCCWWGSVFLKLFCFHYIIRDVSVYVCVLYCLVLILVPSAGFVT